MADYLTTDTELTSIANAIRSKGGTSASLAYPTDFVTAINAIARGGNHTVSIDNFDFSSLYGGWVQYDGTNYYSGDSFVYEDAIPKKKIKIGFSLISYPAVSSWRILDIDGTVLYSYTFPSAPYNDSYEMEVDDDITINCTTAYGTATVQLYKSAYYGANVTASAVISPYQFYDKYGVLTQGSVISRAVSSTQLTPSVYSTTITSGAYNTTATVTVLAEATTVNPAATSQTINASTKFFNKITVNSAPLSKISKTYTSVNQTETINIPTGYYGISSVTVTVAIPAKSSNAILTSTTQTYTQNNYSVTVPPAKLSAVATSYTSNGTYTISVPQNYYGITTATVTVSVSGGTPSYVATNLTAGDAIIDKTFYQATSTTTVTRVTGAGFLDRRSSVYTVDGVYGVSCGSAYVTITPDWDSVIGGRSDPWAPDPDYYPHSDTGLKIASNWVAFQAGLIDSPNDTTSSILLTGHTILGITGTATASGADISNDTVDPSYVSENVSFHFWDASLSQPVYAFGALNDSRPGFYSPNLVTDNSISQYVEFYEYDDSSFIGNPYGAIMSKGRISYSELASVIGLTSAKLKPGETVLGITGTAGYQCSILNNGVGPDDAPYFKCYITYDGDAYSTAQSLMITPGDSITCEMVNMTRIVYVNGVAVSTGQNSYTYTPTGDFTVTFDMPQTNYPDYAYIYIQES